MAEMTIEQQRALAMASARLRMQGQTGAAERKAAGEADMRRLADPTGSFTENLAAGAGKAVADTGRGLRQIFAWGADKIAPRSPSMSDLIAGRDPSRSAGIQAEIDEAKARDKPLMDTGGGLTGNIAGHVAVSALPGGAAGSLGKAKVAQALLAPRTLKGAVALGAGTGAVGPVASDESRLQNMAVGGAGGAVGQAIPRVAGAILRGNQRPQVQALLDEGVKLTPGQILGGTGQRLEEAATSIPLMGDAIRSSMKRSQESFNTAALNRALAPIGDKTAKIGREGIEEVESKLGAFYDRLLPKLTAKLDPQFAVDVRTLKAAGANLPQEQAAQFDKILNNEMLSKFKNGRMTGEEMKVVESELGRLARGYQGDSAFANRELARTIRDAQTALRDLVTRGNPQFAPELKKANEGWANFVRVQRAASGVGAAGGEFTPSQLASAVKANDSSLRKGGFARGDALMQDLSDAGVSVMRKNVPDSGTPLRAMVGLGSLGGVAAVNPYAAAGVAGGIGAYTPPMQAVIRALLARRPELLRQAGAGVSSTAPALTLPGAAVAQSLMEQQ